MPKKVIEILFAIAILALSALGFLQGLDYAGQSKVVPVAVTGFAMLLCCLWILQCVYTLALSQAETVSIVPAEAMRLTTSIVLIVVYVLAVLHVGFFTTTAIYLPLVSVSLGLRKPLSIAVTTVLLLVVLYSVFGLLLRTPLPPEIVVHWITRS